MKEEATKSFPAKENIGRKEGGIPLIQLNTQKPKRPNGNGFWGRGEGQGTENDKDTTNNDKRHRQPTHILCTDQVYLFLICMSLHLFVKGTFVKDYTTCV
jgi:hypothetical protein